MTKYSTEIKIKVVEDYVNNAGGYEFLTKKYGVNNESDNRKWESAFQSQGYDG